MHAHDQNSTPDQLVPNFTLWTCGKINSCCCTGMTGSSLMTVSFLWDRISCSPGYPWIHCIIKDDHEFLISLPPLLQCWEYGHGLWVCIMMPVDNFGYIMEHSFVLLSLSFSSSHLYHSNIPIVTQVLKMTISSSFLKGKEILTLALCHTHSFPVYPMWSHSQN